MYGKKLKLKNLNAGGSCSAADSTVVGRSNDSWERPATSTEGKRAESGYENPT